MSRPELQQDCHAIVLAAGASVRFGGGKLTAPLRSRPLVAWATEAALSTCVETVTVVTGADGDRVQLALAPLRGPRLNVVKCGEWNEGLAASLRCGMDSLPAAARAALIFLGDMPDVSPDLGDRLLAEVLGGAPAALPVYRDVPGHPVAISNGLFPRLAELAGDRGARAVLSGLDGLIRMATDDAGCIRDIDTSGDLATLDSR